MSLNLEPINELHRQIQNELKKSMKRIFKYDLKIADYQEIKMPIGAEVLSVQLQDGDLKIWAIVDPEKEVEVRHFEIYGTGHELSNNGPRKFLGTVQQNTYMCMVWHVFEYIGV